MQLALFKYFSNQAFTPEVRKQMSEDKIKRVQSMLSRRADKGWKTRKNKQIKNI